MGLDNLLATLEKRDSVTSVTSVTLGNVTAECPSLLACTPVTPVTCENDDTSSEPETLLDQQREARRQKVIAMLDAATDLPRAIDVDDSSDPHNIILCVAVRHPTAATCEMLIPRDKYNPWVLLELLMRHGQVTH